MAEVCLELGLLTMVAVGLHPGKEFGSKPRFDVSVFRIRGEVIPFVIVFLDKVEFFFRAKVVSPYFFRGVGIVLRFPFPRVEDLSFPPFRVLRNGDYILEFHFGSEVPDVLGL